MNVRTLLAKRKYVRNPGCSWEASLPPTRYKNPSNMLHAVMFIHAISILCCTLLDQEQVGRSFDIDLQDPTVPLAKQGTTGSTRRTGQFVWDPQRESGNMIYAMRITLRKYSRIRVRTIWSAHESGSQNNEKTTRNKSVSGAGSSGIGLLTFGTRKALACFFPSHPPTHPGKWKLDRLLVFSSKS